VFVLHVQTRGLLRFFTITNTKKNNNTPKQDIYELILRFEPYTEFKEVKEIDRSYVFLTMSQSAFTPSTIPFVSVAIVTATDSPLCSIK